MRRYAPVLLAWYFIAAGTQYGPFESKATCEQIRAQMQSSVKSDCWRAAKGA